MKFKVLFLILLVTALTLSFVYSAQAPKPYRGFSIGMPDLVDAGLGDLVTINGTILNFGWWWLHDFNLTAAGLPKDYTVIFYPGHFDDVRILRDWNPEKGLYLVPEKFNMTIKVPQNASGIYTVNITGQEFMSWRQVYNSTAFLFRVSTPPKLSLSDLVIPEQVTEFQPFNISFDVKNEGAIDQLTNISVKAPETWTVSPSIKTLTVKSNSSESVIFSITPTNTSGEISVLMLYPYRAQILNITKAGPTLIPTAPVAPIIPTGLSVLFEQFKGIPTWILIIVIVFLVIIVWNVYKLLKGYKFRVVRKKPEEIKKQVATAEVQPETFEPLSENNLL